MSLDELRALIATGEPSSGAAQTLQYRTVDAGPGWAIVEMEPRADLHGNIGGNVQGGVIAAAIDSALGSAVRTVTDDGQNFVTLDLSCRYIRAIKPGTGTVSIRAEVEHAGRTTATVRAQVHDGGGRLVASATSTLLLLSR
ncbi:hypothetical protein GOEFS_015_00520 [Gordonia effusa NBRC 100432]|uniref:Thioesterase domain-containing protein n=1 Tax=Gordonia effusa NBRC 100432 TaxID=1077974 RepID=H0QVH8_9ACTN|nr:PaaI family thioesterase [Gordonia effusa]GAB16855.1 hypothetical protein GOEFS_015_00520 [Gordonia effusa NBRC 100432]